MVPSSSEGCQKVGDAVVSVLLLLCGMLPGNFNPKMQGRFVEGMVASINVPDEHFEIRGAYLERSRRARRGLDEDLVVNVAITAEENEASNKVEANVMIAVRTSNLKRYLEITGVEGIDDLILDRESVAVSEKGILCE
jgi:hypothetical protein